MLTGTRNAVRNMEYIYNYHLEHGERPYVFLYVDQMQNKRKKSKEEVATMYKLGDLG